MALSSNAQLKTLVEQLFENTKRCLVEAEFDFAAAQKSGHGLKFSENGIFVFDQEYRQKLDQTVELILAKLGAVRGGEKDVTGTLTKAAEAMSSDETSDSRT